MQVVLSGDGPTKTAVRIQEEDGRDSIRTSRGLDRQALRALRSPPAGRTRDPRPASRDDDDVPVREDGHGLDERRSPSHDRRDARVRSGVHAIPQDAQDGLTAGTGRIRSYAFGSHATLPPGRK